MAAVICTMAFTLPDVLLVWISPLPGTVQKQVDIAIDHGWK